MKSFCIAITLGTLLGMSGLVSATDSSQSTAKQSAAATTSSLKTDADKVSYSIGMDIGRNFTAQNISVDPKLFLQGFEDGLKGVSPQMAETEVKDTLVRFQQDLMQKRAEEMKKLAQDNKKAGDTYLKANKQKKGVVTTKSGLQYRMISEGTGPKPGVTDIVTTHYKGHFVDGTEFDSSYARNEPAVFPVNGVIPGWTEALQLMPVGSKFELVVPPELAYGESGAGGKIGPNATLIFDVELLGVKKAEATTTAAPAVTAK